MNAKTNKSSVSTKTAKDTKLKNKTAVDKTAIDKTAIDKTAISPDYVVRRLNEDVRNSILVVSVLVNLFVLIGWLVIEVSSRYDAALIYYLQNR